MALTGRDDPGKDDSTTPNKAGLLACVDSDPVGCECPETRTIRDHASSSITNLIIGKAFPQSAGLALAAAGRGGTVSTPNSRDGDSEMGRSPDSVLSCVDMNGEALADGVVR